MGQDAITQDYLLGGRVQIRQPAEGYRVAIDPIFLAASLQPESGTTILDIGAGVGAAALCLAARIPDCRITGLETQRDIVRLAFDNIALNNMRDRVEIIAGDLLRPPPRLAAGTFAHVMANPPYLEASHHTPSIKEQKAHSHGEGEATLEHWVRFALLMVRPKGTVTFIHRADRLDQIISTFAGKMGDIVIYPLWPGKDKPAKRVLIRGCKNSNGPLRLASGMMLHGSDGRFTPQAEMILRDGAALIL
ncbi:MAG: methyltransferase [Alphaproteobacteria bacterium]|nr:methyltransferase [Alphaproteobacteria bacterium]